MKKSSAPSAVLSAIRAAEAVALSLSGEARLAALRELGRLSAAPLPDALSARRAAAVREILRNSVPGSALSARTAVRTVCAGKG